MGRLVRSRLKTGINIRRDSYFLIISCTSLLLYAICLYSFLHLNGYIGAKGLTAASSTTSLTATTADESAGSRRQDVRGARGGGKTSERIPSQYLRSQNQFDDGKIHEFQHNVGQPVDWEMRVKGKLFFK